MKIDIQKFRYECLSTWTAPISKNDRHNVLTYVTLYDHAAKEMGRPVYRCAVSILSMTAYY